MPFRVATLCNCEHEFAVLIFEKFMTNSTVRVSFQAPTLRRLLPSTGDAVNLDNKYNLNSPCSMLLQNSEDNVVT